MITESDFTIFYCTRFEMKFPLRTFDVQMIVIIQKVIM